MDMVKTIALAFTVAGCAAGADFSIEIGNPVAANAVGPNKLKTMVMSVRAQGCADPGKGSFTGTGVRMNAGRRESVTLAFVAGSAPGAFGVIGGWPPFEGPWVAVITGDCLGAKAGAVVPIRAQGYVREASRFFSHAPTEAEIEAAF